MNYELVLGLEIHLQLKTKSKMFCGCDNNPFDAESNTNVCPVCLGLPGAMPVPNADAVKLSQKLAQALGSCLSDNVIFERKNYFYPDLPKGFQITCPHYPISSGGELHRVGFREIHLEEDTAKSLHKHGKTYLDFNKSGVPLLEIVTEPDFHDVDLAVNFCKEMQLIARRLDVSDADMEKGHMRLEANISIREKGSRNLPDYRVEIKNINSFVFMRKAVLYELRRQAFALDNGQSLDQETRGFDVKSGRTFVQRTKEDAHDYRYFPEPDIPKLTFDSKWTENITTSNVELPAKTREILKDLGLNEQYVEVFVKREKLNEKFKKLMEKGYTPSKAADFVINVAEYKNKSAEEIDKLEREKKEKIIDSEDSLLPIIAKVISENPKVVNDYKGGNEKSIQFLIGQVMMQTQGTADPRKVNELLSSKLVDM